MKELEEIYQEMLDCFAQRTGLEAAESCDLAVRFYAVAAQVYALYAQADWVLRQSFPQTAAGSCLDSHAQLRGLSRKQATAAEGSIRFSVARAADTDRPIPAGTVCMTPGLIRFETAQAAVLEAGASWVDVAVKIDGGADQAGAAERVKTALQQWFTGERLGQDVLRARLGSLIFGCEGVKNYELTAPPEDLALEPDQLPVLGTLTVEAMQ